MGLVQSNPWAWFRLLIDQLESCNASISFPSKRKRITRIAQDLFCTIGHVESGEYVLGIEDEERTKDIDILRSNPLLHIISHLTS